ncbi:SRPBCC family protein [candidate division KSB1 bacterium]|nr:SRPBCC family protein [candidate division KSB1 bacterium]
MQIEETIKIKATPEQIFAFYKNVSEWSSWDPDVQSSSIDGDFREGTKGKLKPSKGPETKIEFTEVTRNKSFTTSSKLPFCTMRFVHELVPTNEGTEVIHTVTFSGMLSPLFNRLIGSGIKKGLPKTMQGLKNAVESKK